ncbi:hypothetical protein ONZ45_g1262 [Pleurotus djamor]|nr:hypothetical protein ONZ45_g1262 [Pleurotus djamor]
MSQTNEHIERAINQTTCFIDGVFELPPQSTKLFFHRGDYGGHVDLLHPTNNQLELLASACEPASFGRNNEDILDETYRKAGKLDVADFSTNLDLTAAGIIAKIRSELLTDHRNVRAELYKLNVYGPGSFFKAHKDTPRGESMFGSLVLILPIPHKGGELVLRPAGQIGATIDSSKSSAASGKSVIKYAAFYGDIEHEVLPVKSGNRVTLTYNLYYADETDDDPTMSAAQGKFVEILKTLVAPGGPDFLPEGGWVGFPLRHEYAFSRDGQLTNVKKNLKGVDVAFSRACNRLKISTRVKVVYKVSDSNRDDRFVSLDHVPTETYQFDQREDGVFDDFIALRDAVEVRWKGSKPSYRQSDEASDEDVHSIFWLMPPRFEDFGGPNIPYVAYGNEATQDFAYGSFYFHLDIAPFAERKALAEESD